MLAGLEEVTHGEIQIDGVTVNHLPPGARGLGMVFQSYALYPHMTIADNLSFGLRLAKGEAKLTGDQIKVRIQEAAEMLDLVEHLSFKVEYLRDFVLKYIWILKILSDEFYKKFGKLGV